MAAAANARAKPLPVAATDLPPLRAVPAYVRIDSLLLLDRVAVGMACATDAPILAAEAEMLRILRAFDRDPPDCEKKSAAACRAWNREQVKVLRAKPRSAAGAAAMLRTLLHPEIGLRCGARGDGADFVALRTLLRFIASPPVRQARRT